MCNPGWSDAAPDQVPPSRSSTAIAISCAALRRPGARLRPGRAVRTDIPHSVGRHIVGASARRQSSCTAWPSVATNTTSATAASSKIIGTRSSPPRPGAALLVPKAVHDAAAPRRGSDRSETRALPTPLELACPTRSTSPSGRRSARRCSITAPRADLPQPLLRNRRLFRRGAYPHVASCRTSTQTTQRDRVLSINRRH